MVADLYNDAIVAEAKANHAGGRLAAATTSVTCDNPLCGDRVTLDLALADGSVRELAQHTRGCLLTQAAASLIGRLAIGATPEQARTVEAELRRLLAGAATVPSWPELAMFTPVRDFKSRHECVLLPFTALVEALEKSDPGTVP